MKIIRANALGLCFGVRDALSVANNVEHPKSVTIYGQLVHNETVLVQLQQRGFASTSERQRSTHPQTDDVLITAHGISNVRRQELQRAGKTLIDTTCPLVRRVHEAATQLEGAGYHIVVIGRPNHVEVRGIVEDLRSFDVVTTKQDVITWPHDRLGVVSQTTTPPRMAEHIHSEILLRNEHAEVRFVDTVCQPTRDRQGAVEQLCSQVDVVVVVGGANSNNTRQLAKLCQSLGTVTHHVQTASDLEPAWFEECGTVGLTAGTSTLDETIAEVQEALEQFAA